MASELSKLIEEELRLRGYQAEDEEAPHQALMGALRVEARVKEQESQKKLSDIKRIVCIGGGIAVVLLVWILLIANSSSEGTTPPRYHSNSTYPAYPVTHSAASAPPTADSADLDSNTTETLPPSPSASNATENLPPSASANATAQQDANITQTPAPANTTAAPSRQLNPTTSPAPAPVPASTNSSDIDSISEKTTAEASEDTEPSAPLAAQNQTDAASDTKNTTDSSVAAPPPAVALNETEAGMDMLGIQGSPLQDVANATNTTVGQSPAANEAKIFSAITETAETAATNEDLEGHDEENDEDPSTGNKSGADNLSEENDGETEVKSSPSPAAANTPVGSQSNETKATVQSQPKSTLDEAGSEASQPDETKATAPAASPATPTPTTASTPTPVAAQTPESKNDTSSDTAASAPGTETTDASTPKSGDATPAPTPVPAEATTPGTDAAEIKAAETWAEPASPPPADAKASSTEGDAPPAQPAAPNTANSTAPSGASAADSPSPKPFGTEMEEDQAEQQREALTGGSAAGR